MDQEAMVILDDRCLILLYRCYFWHIRPFQYILLEHMLQELEEAEIEMDLLQKEQALQEVSRSSREKTLCSLQSPASYRNGSLPLFFFSFHFFLFLNFDSCHLINLKLMLFYNPIDFLFPWSHKAACCLYVNAALHLKDDNRLQQIKCSISSL